MCRGFINASYILLGFERWITSVLQPAVNIEDESESEESQYSGLDEEPDTSVSEGDEDEDAVEEDEDNELLSDKREEVITCV